MNRPPDTKAVLAGLKDFQKATVDYPFERFYGPDSTRRFLVADEVGLGKTLVARGVIARAIDHLGKKPRIDVIYICSNADIARQNIQRLRIPGCTDAAQATRLTLLPLKMEDLRRSRINFVALTSATSFDQTAGGGRDYFTLRIPASVAEREYQRRVVAVAGQKAANTADLDDSNHEVCNGQ